MEHSPGHSLVLKSSGSPEPGFLVGPALLAKKTPRVTQHEIPDWDPEIPYYDAEFDVPQSQAHKDVVSYFLGLIQKIGSNQNLLWLSDNPIWYPEPPPGNRSLRYADIALARKSQRVRVHSEDLLLVLEVVTSHHPGKRKKDTVRQRLLNERHGVPEFGLVWPEMKDQKVFNLFRLDPASKTYREVVPDDQCHIHSQSIPGLSFVIQPPEAWVSGEKVIAYYQGRRHHNASEELALRLMSESRALQETQEKLAAVDLADKAERKASQAQQEKLAAEDRATQAEKKAEELMALLRKLGVEPPS